MKMNSLLTLREKNIVLSPQRHGRGNKFRAVRVRSPTPWEWGGVGEREIVVASHLGKTVGWGRSLTQEDWVHVTNFVSRWLDSGFGIPWCRPSFRLLSCLSIIMVPPAGWSCRYSACWMVPPGWYWSCCFRPTISTMNACMVWLVD